MYKFKFRKKRGLFRMADFQEEVYIIEKQEITDDEDDDFDYEKMAKDAGSEEDVDLNADLDLDDDDDDDLNDFSAL